MVFSSPAFLFFFLPITLLLAYLCNRYKWRNIPLLIMSLLFYAFGEGEMVLVMFGSIVMNYFIGKWVGRASNNIAITTGIILNLLLLIIYKYASFVIDNLNFLLVFAGIHPLKQVIIKLPIGISFYTFHCMSYLIDVYRRKNEAQKSFIDLALYVSLFPQLVAGPIIRYKDVALQFQQRILSSSQFYHGLERFIIGLGKKVIIANTMGQCADMVFGLDPSGISTTLAWVGILSYGLQLYFDFSAYSDMAIGLGRMLGFHFLENFRFPYLAKSIREFWQRWHISLSNWFRDYLYIPLGGNRVSPGRVYLNLFIVFFLTGLWHGASWNFVIWGLIHGLFMVIERLGFDKVLEKLPPVFQRIYMLSVVMIGWVFFRADNLDQSMVYMKSLFAVANIPAYGMEMVLNKEFIIVSIVAVIMAFNGFNKILRKVFKPLLENYNSATVAKWIFLNGKTVFLLLVFAYSSLSIAAGSYNPFIYFRF